MEVQLYAKDVAGILGNDISWPNTTNLFYKRRLYFTINTGCTTVNGKFPVATGTPHGVPQEGNPWIKKSAYVGFVGTSQAGEMKMRWATRIHDYWIDGADYDTLLVNAVHTANFDYPIVTQWLPEVIGYGFIEYNGRDGR